MVFLCQHGRGSVMLETSGYGVDSAFPSQFAPLLSVVTQLGSVYRLILEY